MKPLHEHVDLCLASIKERGILVCEDGARWADLVAVGMLPHEAVQLIRDNSGATHGAYQVTTARAKFQSGVRAQHKEVLIGQPSQGAIHAWKPVLCWRFKHLPDRVIQRGAGRLDHDPGGQDDHREGVAVDDDSFAVAADAYFAAIYLFIDLEHQSARVLREADQRLLVRFWHAATGCDRTDGVAPSLHRQAQELEAQSVGVAHVEPLRGDVEGARRQRPTRAQCDSMARTNGCKRRLCRTEATSNDEHSS
mmetsp:Transcript_1817/g.4091  ORF Transcript_1817/g.4091 Transcript_1817/m.4091 type:complete len:251 (-) Transcript_1817:521-1273(-)